MRDRVAWQALKLALYVMIALALAALLLGCQTVERKPLVIEGAIQCVPQSGRIFCAVSLKEKVDE